MPACGGQEPARNPCPIATSLRQRVRQRDTNSTSDGSIWPAGAGASGHAAVCTVTCAGARVRVPARLLGCWCLRTIAAFAWPAPRTQLAWLGGFAWVRAWVLAAAGQRDILCVSSTARARRSDGGRLYGIAPPPSCCSRHRCCQGSCARRGWAVSTRYPQVEALALGAAMPLVGGSVARAAPPSRSDR